MSRSASNILGIAWILAGLLFFKGFLIPVALGLFIAAILLYIKKLLHLKKRMILVSWMGILILVWWGLRLWWSQLIESIGELSSSIQAAISSITTGAESRRWISLQWTDAQSVFNQIQWIASSLPLWSFWLWFMGILIDALLVVVYSFLFVVYEKKVVSALSTFSSQAAKYWKLWIKKSAQYIWSLLTISLVLWILYSVILLVLWVEFALLIAVAAALCTLVPTVWTAIWVVWASIATYAVTWSLTTTLIVLACFGCVQVLEEYTILPAIAGKKLDINPLATILSIVLGGILRWVAWVFLILPVVSILQEIIEDKNSDHWFIKFTQ